VTTAIEAPRGTLDVLPADQPLRDRILEVSAGTAGRYGYERLTIPTFEDTQLFARTSGQGSDVVSKEMYTFEDRAGRSLTLRPEATASICRLYVEHGLHRAPLPFKAFFAGPMFRYAAPQRGRYREFWQVDVEAIGSEDAALDAELIELFTAIGRDLGITSLRLELNSIGCRACRPAYLERLRAWLADHDAELDDDARTKAATSPLRVFDVKSPRVRAALEAAPAIGDSLCDACAAHFAELRSILDTMEVRYAIEPTLVRGLDYYTRTVFEFVNEALDAAQSTVCAGGRYDYLVEEIGGRPTPGIGWAAGVERLAMSLPPGAVARAPADVFFVVMDGAPRTRLLALMTELRATGLRCDTDFMGRSLKGQLTQAARAHAGTIVIAGADGATVRRAGEHDVAVEFDPSMSALRKLIAG
jgi:histidyl-tRNA synthetase